MHRHTAPLLLGTLWFGGIVASAAVAHAERFVSPRLQAIDNFREHRCRFGDDLYTNEAGLERAEWARQCSIIHPDHVDDMLWRISNMKPVPRDRYNYPTFAYDAPGYPVWKPDVSRHGDGSLNCAVPPNVIWLGNCVIGCYRTDQEVLFSDGYRAIGSAATTRKKMLMTLSPASTLEHPILASSKVGAYSTDPEPVLQPLVTLDMASGGSLTVTPNHPLLVATGAMVTADSVREGDALLDWTGQADAVVHLTHDETETQVFNLRPESENKTENIIVAQGYLNGSGRYQNEYAIYLNQLALRASIPAQDIDE